MKQGQAFPSSEMWVVTFPWQDYYCYYCCWWKRHVEGRALEAMAQGQRRPWGRAREAVAALDLLS